MPNRPDIGRKAASLALFLALLTPLAALAEEKGPQEPTPATTPACSVITVAPGDGLDALFGHTAIRIRDPQLGSGDVWFDYGVFNPGDAKTGEITIGSAAAFFMHYAKGDAKYLLVAAAPQDRLAHYKAEGRQVTEQVLDLKPEEVRKLEDFLLDDLRHGCGKEGYEYRFLDDNCTTRVAKAIEGVTGEKLSLEDRESRRYFTDCFLSAKPPVQLGANLLMGSHAEQKTIVFLPAQLEHAIGHAHRKLEKAKTGETATHVGWAVLGHIQSHMATMVLFFPCLVLVWVAGIFPTLLRHKKKIPLPRRGFLDFLLFGLIGLIGCLMSFLGVWSLHPELGAFNWNLIWCWPTHLLFALVLLFKAHSPLARNYARVAAIGTGLAALAYFFVPQALPLPLFPLALLLALRAWRWGWAPAAQETPSM